MNLEINKISLDLLSEKLDNSKKSVIVDKKDIINKHFITKTSKISVVINYKIMSKKPQFKSEIIEIVLEYQIFKNEEEKSIYIRQHCEDIFIRFNNTLRPDEKKRKFVSCHYIVEQLKFIKI